MSYVRVQNSKTLAQTYEYWLKNSDTETNTLDVEKIKNHRKQNFEDEATDMMQLTKRICNEATSVVIYPDSFICCYCVQ